MKSGILRYCSALFEYNRKYPNCLTNNAKLGEAIFANNGELYPQCTANKPTQQISDRRL